MNVKDKEQNYILTTEYANDKILSDRDVNEWIPRWDPLTIATVEGHAGIVGTLLRRGFGENWRAKIVGDDDDESVEKIGTSTPLHRAAFNGRFHTLCELMRHFFPESAATEARLLKLKDADGNTLLHAAAAGTPRSKRADVVGPWIKIMEILIHAGCDPTQRNRHGNRPRALCANESGQSLLRRCEDQLRQSSNRRRMCAGLLSVSKNSDDGSALTSMCADMEDVSTTDTNQLQSLESLLNAARRSFVPPAILSRAEAIVRVLRCKLDLERSMAQLNAARPCDTNAPALELSEAVRLAASGGVDQASILRANDLIQATLAEVKLQQGLNVCAEIALADASHAVVRDALERNIASCASVGGDEELLMRASLVLSKLSAEIALQTVPPEPSATETAGLVDTQLAVLRLTRQVQHLTDALTTASKEGVGADPDLVSRSRSKLKKLRSKLEDANRAEEVRQEEAEKARLKAMKKKKKKGGKKKK